jgi:hypothetical protein
MSIETKNRLISIALASVVSVASVFGFGLALPPGCGQIVNEPAPDAGAPVSDAGTDEDGGSL